MSEQETHSSDDRIECPACGETAASDLWEMSPNEEDIETECGSCGVPLNIRRQVSVDYWCTVAKGDVPLAIDPPCTESPINPLPATFDRGPQ